MNIAKAGIPHLVPAVPFIGRRTAAALDNRVRGLFYDQFSPHSIFVRTRCRSGPEILTLPAVWITVTPLLLAIITSTGQPPNQRKREKTMPQMKTEKRQIAAAEQYKLFESIRTGLAAKMLAAGRTAAQVAAFSDEQSQLNEEYLARHQRAEPSLTLAELKTVTERHAAKRPVDKDDGKGLSFNLVGDFVSSHCPALIDTRCQVVHGYHYCRSESGSRWKIAHAWLLFTDFDYLYDPYLGVFQASSPVYEPVYLYTLTEMTENARKFKTYGPWSELTGAQAFSDEDVLPFHF
jgi:hypothetical protein